MCHAVYLASSKKLPTSKWIEDVTFFSIEEERKENPVYKKFSFTNVYYCNSHSGCSCGFSYDYNDQDDEEDKKQNDWGKQSVFELFDFLKSNIQSAGSLELYMCWEGDEDDKVESRNEVDLSSFQLGSSFEFKEKEFITVFCS